LDVTLEINDNETDLIQEQLQLETDMLTGGVSRFRRTTEQAIQKGMESNTAHGRAIVIRLVKTVAQGLKEHLDNPSNISRDISWKKLNGMDVDTVAYLSIVHLVDAISSKNTLLYVARSLGAGIEIQDRLDRWIADEGDIARNTIKQAMKKAYGARRYGLTNKMNKDGYTSTSWSKSERVHVGFKMIDIIIRTTGLVRLDTQVTSRKRRSTCVIPSEETMHWIKEYNKYVEVLKPKYLPCIIPPKQWTDVTGGGYHGHDIDELPIVRRR